MRNIWTIARKEMNSYFRSPIGYFILAIFAFLFGFIYYRSVADFIFTSLTRAQYAQMYGQSMPPMNVNEMVIRGLLSTTSFFLLFLVPMITMRLFAEEKKTGTIELLMTSPITEMQLVLGKFFGSLLLYSIMLGITVPFMMILFRYGNPDWKPVVAGYLGQLLLGGTFISLGLMFSTFTRNQLIAASLTFTTLLLLWVIGFWSQSSGSAWAQIASYIAILTHIESFTKGVIELKDTLYYLSAIGLGLFLSVRSVESTRWRA